MTKDMSVGTPYKVLLKFSFPMIISMMFQQLYNIADSIIAGRMISRDALAAIGSSAPITSIFVMIAVGFSVGSSVVVAKFFGSKNFRNLKTAVSTTLISGTVLTIITTVCGLLLYTQIMQLIKTPTEIFDDSAAYLSVYIYGFAFMLFYNIANSVSVALGDSKTPLFFLIFSTIFNVILDIIFVNQGMGVAGLAWATFIAQGMSAVLSLAFMIYRLKKLKCEKHEKFKLFDLKIYIMLTKIAIPSIIQQSVVSIGQVAIQGLINAMGTIIIAAYAAAIKINVFVVASINTMSNAMSAYTAQNLGANKPERVKMGLKSAFIIVEVLGVALIAVLFLFAKPLVGLFLDPAEGGVAEVIKNGSLFLYILAPGYLILCFKIVCDGVLRGIGDITKFMLSTMFDLVARVAIAYILAPYIGFLGIALSFPLGWLLGSIVSVMFYLMIRKKRLVKKVDEISLPDEIPIPQ